MALLASDFEAGFVVGRLGGHEFRIEAQFPRLGRLEAGGDVAVEIDGGLQLVHHADPGAHALEGRLSRYRRPVDHVPGRRIIEFPELLGLEIEGHSIVPCADIHNPLVRRPQGLLQINAPFADRVLCLLREIALSVGCGIRQPSPRSGHEVPVGVLVPVALVDLPCNAERGGAVHPRNRVCDIGLHVRPVHVGAAVVDQARHRMVVRPFLEIGQRLELDVADLLVALEARVEDVAVPSHVSPLFGCELADVVFKLGLRERSRQLQVRLRHRDVRLQRGFVAEQMPDLETSLIGAEGVPFPPGIG